MLTKSRPRTYELPGASVRGSYQVWHPNPKHIDSDGEHDRYASPIPPLERPQQLPPTTARHPYPVQAQQYPPQRASAQVRTSDATTASQQWNWPRAHPDLSSTSSLGSRKYSTPPTSAASSLNPKRSHLDAPQDIQRTSSWRSSADRSLLVDDDRPAARGGRPSTTDSNNSGSSGAGSIPPTETEQRAAAVRSPPVPVPQRRSTDPVPVWPTAASVAPQRTSERVFVPPPVQSEAPSHTRRNSLDRHPRRDEPQRGGYLTDVSEADEMASKIRSPGPRVRSPDVIPAPVAFPVYYPDQLRTTRTSLTSAQAPAREVPAAEAQKPDTKGKSADVTAPAPRAQASKGLWSVNKALPADDEVVVQRPQKSGSGSAWTTVTALPPPPPPPEKPDHLPNPSRRATAPTPVPKETRSSATSSIQIPAQPTSAPQPILTSAVNVKHMPATVQIQPSSRTSAHGRIPSNASATYTSAAGPAAAYATTRPATQAPLPSSNVQSPASSRPPTAPPLPYVKPQATGTVLPSSSGGAATSKSAIPPTPHRNATSLPSSNPTSYLHPTSPQPQLYPVTGLRTAVPATPYRPISSLPSQAPPVVQTNPQATQRHAPPPLSGVTSPRHANRAPTPLSDASPAEDTIIKPPMSASRRPTSPGSGAEDSRRRGGGLFSLFRSRSQKNSAYEVWMPPATAVAEREREQALQRTESAKEQPRASTKTASSRTKEAAQVVVTAPTMSAQKENIIYPPTQTSYLPRGNSTTSVPRQSSQNSIAMPVPIAAAAGRKSPLPKGLPTAFRLFSKRRYRTVSTASLEAVDGTAANTGGLNSPASSVRSPTPGASPPLRDPILAAQEWRNREEADLRDQARTRRPRPGVTFDVALEDSPTTENRTKPKRAHAHRTATPVAFRSAILPDEGEDTDDEDDDDEDGSGGR